MPPIPHIAAPNEPALPEPVVARPVKAPIWKNRKVQIGAALGILIGAAGGAWFVLRPAPMPPPPPKAVKPAVAAPKAAAPAPTPAIADKPAAPAPALSETQAAIAHAPVNAINKAKDVVGKREGSGQGRDAVGVITDGEAPKAPASRPATRAPVATVAGSSSIAPGVSATNSDVAAESEASPAFRSFVANAKVSGVFQGNPPRVMLNGRLARGGDTIDSNLGVIFDGVDPDKKLLIFKDKSGATVTRRY